MDAFQDAPLLNQPDTYGYYINLNERGVFHADLRTKDDVSLITITNEVFDENGDHAGYGEIDLVDTGYMKHGQDVNGLCEYAVSAGIIQPGSRVLSSRDFEQWLENQDEAAPSQSQTMRLG